VNSLQELRAQVEGMHHPWPSRGRGLIRAGVRCHDGCRCHDEFKRLRDAVLAGLGVDVTGRWRNEWDKGFDAAVETVKAVMQKALEGEG